MSRGHQYAENEHESYGNSNKKGKQKISLLSKIGLNKPTKMKTSGVVIRIIIALAFIRKLWKRWRSKHDSYDFANDFD